MNRREFIKGAMIMGAAVYFSPIIAFGAENLAWWQKKSIYQVYPKSFFDTSDSGTGDLRGVIQKLDYIKSLDVGAIWLTPFYPSPMVDNGYDIANYTDIDPRFGNMDDFDELIAESDKRGIKIIVDLVFNHSSDQNKWFLESKSSKNNPKSDWYIWRDGKNGKPPTNWRGIFGGSAWEWCEEREQYYLHTFATQQPDLNWENPEVRQALYDSANFWLKKGAGGFRIDAIVYIKKPAEFLDGKPDSPDGTCSIHNIIAATPGILDFLNEFKEKVFVGRDIFTVAEANGVKPDDLSKWVGENGVFNTLFEFSHVNLMFENGAEIWHRAKPIRLTELKKSLTDSQKATKNSWYPIYFENHDRARSVNVYFPNQNPILAAKALAIILFSLRGTPFIYQGEELGLENAKFDSIDDFDDISTHGNYNLARADGLSDKEAMKFANKFSRDNARTPMQWNSSKNAGFTTANKAWLPVHSDFKRCNVEIQEKNPDSVLNFYRKLSKFRNSSEILLRGEYVELYPENEDIYVFSRNLGDKKLIICVNFTNRDVKNPIKGGKKIIGNYSDEKNYLRATEAIIYEF